MRELCRPILLVALSILGVSLFSTFPIQRAHAAGLVYVSPSTLPTSSAGSVVTVQVQVSNVDPFTGWDIEIRTDQSILNPTGVSIDGNLLATNFGATMILVAACVNGQGTGCGSEDGLGVAHSAAAALGSKSVPPGPTSGLLFTITYKALNGGLGVSLVEIIRQIIVNGVTASIIDVSTANAVYGDAQDFGVQLTPLFPNVSQGSETVVNATIISFNGFTGSVNLTANSVLSAYAIPARVFLPPGGSVTAQLFASSTLCDFPSSYSLGLVVASGNISHEIRAFPNLNPNTALNPDFCMTRFERQVDVHQGTQTTIPFLLSSANKFNGTVSMTLTLLPNNPNGPNVTLKSSKVTMYPGGFGDGEIQVSTTLGTLLGEYTVVVNATSGHTSHFLTETVSVVPPAPIFTINAASTSVTVAPGTSTTDMITLESLFGFNGPVAIGTTIQPFIATGPQVSLSLYTFQLSSSANSTLTISAPRDATIGNYSVQVFAMGGGLRSAVNVTINVVPLSPPYFTQFQWNRKVSIGKGGVETFTMGVHNPNKSTIYVDVQLVGVDSFGSQIIALSTGVIQLYPSQTMPGITLSASFSPSETGATFFFVATMTWSVTPSPLSITASAQKGPPTSGTFTIVA